MPEDETPHNIWRRCDEEMIAGSQAKRKNKDRGGVRLHYATTVKGWILLALQFFFDHQFLSVHPRLDRHFRKPILE